MFSLRLSRASWKLSEKKQFWSSISHVDSPCMLLWISMSARACLRRSVYRLIVLWILPSAFKRRSWFSSSQSPLWYGLHASLTLLNSPLFIMTWTFVEFLLLVARIAMVGRRKKDFTIRYVDVILFRGISRLGMALLRIPSTVLLTPYCHSTSRRNKVESMKWRPTWLLKEVGIFGFASILLFPIAFSLLVMPVPYFLVRFASTKSL